MSPKSRFQIMLEPDQIGELRALQETTGAPVAEHIRRAVAEYLAKKDIAKILRATKRREM